MRPLLRLVMVLVGASVLPAAPEVVEVGPQRALRTLEEARDQVRRLRRESGLPEGVIVRIDPGVMERTRTFVLSAEDSGRPNAPVVWTAVRPGATQLTGGRVVERFRPVAQAAPAVAARLPAAVRDRVVVIDLAEAGVTHPGTIEQRGSPGLELFSHGRRQPLARYPNEGWLRIAAVPQTGLVRLHEGLEREKRFHGVPAGRHYGRIAYEGDRPAQWSADNDFLLHGYWTWDWSDSYQRVAAIDPARREITLAPPHHHYGYTTGQRYRVLNVIEELDAPGEWCLDRAAGRIYFLPPAEAAPGAVRVSVLEAPLVRFESVGHLEFSGFELTASRGAGLEILGGEAVTIAGCTLRNLGGRAITIEGGRRHTVQSCDLHELARGGLAVEGGDRDRLIAGEHRIVNNHIHHFGRWLRTGENGITVAGVGHYVAHNRLHDGPHTAMLHRGNDHLIELNEIHEVCQETGDAGAIYTGRDYTWQGNVIRHNYLHDLSGPGQHGVTAVYLDDFASGYTVTGNLFHRAGKGVQVGGGRDNVVTGNVFIDCEPAIHLDARGLGWAHYFFNGSNRWLTDRFAERHADRPPYADRYPRLRTLLLDAPAVPKGNVIARNLVAGGSWLVLFDYWAYDFHATVAVRDNWVSSPALVRRLAERTDAWDPYYLNSTTAAGYRTWRRDEPEMRAEFAGNRLDPQPPVRFDPATRSLTPTDPAALEALGVTLPPVAAMGLQVDRWRPVLPSR